MGRDTAISLAKGTLFKRAMLYIPALGMPGRGDSLGIPANAPHKEAAMLLVAYLIGAGMQKHRVAQPSRRATNLCIG